MAIDQTTFTDNRVQLQSGGIRYREAGTGPPIVFVHGFLANGNLWMKTAPLLAAGHRCIVPDWPTGAHSEAMGPRADTSPRGVARLISEFLAKLGLDDVTIVGNDAGGAISQILVTEMPERIGRLVLTNCDCFEKFPPKFFKPMIVAARISAGYDALVHLLRLRAVRNSPIAFGWLTTSRPDDAVLSSFTEPQVHDSGVRRDGRAFVTGGDVSDTMGAAAKLPDLKIPALLAWGTEDRFFTLEDARRLDGLIPDSRIVEIPGAACFVPLDRPRELAEAIGAFVGD